MEKIVRALKANSRAGFTLIEILLVVVIIGILVGMAIPRLGGRVRQAEEARARADIQNIGMALRLYELDMGEYPASLEALVTNPGGSRRWNGPYLEGGIPNDPWGERYIYQRTDRSYTLTSSGLDTAESGRDNSP